MLSYKQANVPVAVEAAPRRAGSPRNATPREQAHVAALEAWIGGDLDRALAVWEEILSAASARRAGVSPRAFQQFLARPAGRDARLGRARDAEMGARPAGLRHGAVLPLLLARGVRRLRGRRAVGPRRDRDRSGRHLGHARGRAHHGDAGPPRRRHRVARRAGAALGGRQQSRCIICGGTARCFIWSGASSTRCSIFTTSASAISQRR